MSVAVLKLKDETLVAFNLNMISRMDKEKDGLYFVHEGVLYTTSDVSGSVRKLLLHPSVVYEKDQIKPFSAEAMFEKFCNL